MNRNIEDTPTRTWTGETQIVEWLQANYISYLTTFGRWCRNTPPIEHEDE